MRRRDLEVQRGHDPTSRWLLMREVDRRRPIACHAQWAARATADQKAVIYRHAGRYRDVLELSCAPLHHGIALLGLRDFEGARKILEKVNTAEAGT